MKLRQQKIEKHCNDLQSRTLFITLEIPFNRLIQSWMRNFYRQFHLFFVNN